MTDQQLAYAIGEDLFAVLRSGMMMKSIAPSGSNFDWLLGGPAGEKEKLADTKGGIPARLGYF